MRAGREAGLLLASTLLAALAATCSKPRAPLRFPHRLHLAELACDAPGQPSCLSCNSCHAPSHVDREHKLPGGALCATCHVQDRHEILPVLALVPPRPYGEIQMPHDVHLAMDGIRGQCIPCHAGVVESGRPTLPPMAQCFTCHEHQAQWDRGQCTPCHAQRDLARTLPQTFLRHDAAFARHHGSLAAQQEQLCSACHTESQCQSCHDLSQPLAVEKRRPERIESNQVHRGDFMTRHALEAASQPSRCMTCHAPETCDACHVARGVSGNRAGSRNPHPPEWVGSNTASSNFHGHAARRDVTACAACHEQGPLTNCIRCHKVGAYGGNPHPAGWRSSQGIDSEMCRYCHG